MKLDETTITKLIYEFILDPQNKMGIWDREKSEMTPLKKHGVDIIMRGGTCGGTRIFIECKKKSEAKTARVQNKECWLNALGQLITRMNTKRVVNGEKTKGSRSGAYKYGLGLYWTGAQTALRRIPKNIAMVLNLHMFAVNDDGKVIHFKPSKFGVNYSDKEFL